MACSIRGFRDRIGLLRVGTGHYHRGIASFQRFAPLSPMYQGIGHDALFVRPLQT